MEGTLFILFSTFRSHKQCKKSVQKEKASETTLHKL